MSQSYLSVDDLRYMKLALAMARRGLGSTMPNPAVGAVIVRGAGDHAVVAARGWTQPGGRPHGETEALCRAGSAARGATLYVTLEPCSHHGHTPPCAEAIIKAGIARVVVAIGDPDARVAGRGVAMLRAAGIEVCENVCADAATEVALGHIRRIRSRRPFVAIKLAVSSNYFVSHAKAGQPVWVTGPAARAKVHMMRGKSDAVLTGIGTVLADNPDLTCRLPGLQDASPIRIVLDRNLRLPLDSELAKSARAVPLWVICTERAAQQNKAQDKVAALARLGVQILPIAPAPASDQRHQDGAPGQSNVYWRTILAALADKGITRLMVEAGPQIARSLSAERELVDDYVLFLGHKPLDETCGTPLSDIWSFDYLIEMGHEKFALAGGETMIHYRARRDL